MQQIHNTFVSGAACDIIGVSCPPTCYWGWPLNRLLLLLPPPTSSYLLLPPPTSSYLLLPPSTSSYLRLAFPRIPHLSRVFYITAAASASYIPKVSPSLGCTIIRPLPLTPPADISMSVADREPGSLPYASHELVSMQVWAACRHEPCPTIHYN